MRMGVNLALVVLLSSLLAIAGSEESLEELLGRAEAAKPADQPGLFLRLADRQLKSADDAFEAGDPAKGQAAVADVVNYAERAGAAARISGKHLKNTEIHVRKIAKRLEEIRRTLNFDDREPLRAAVDRLEHIRTQLLAQMFERK